MQNYENKTATGVLGPLTEENMALKHRLETLDYELAGVNKSCKESLQIITNVLNEEKSKAENEHEAQRAINVHVNKTLGDLVAKQSKLEKENEALKHSIFEIETRDAKLKIELAQWQAVISSLTETTTVATTTQTPYICEEGWKSFDGHCYLRVLEEESWDNASAFCESRGSYLLEITSDAELEYVGELMRIILDKFWIGATDRETEGVYVYQHSKQRVPDKYWSSTEPDNYNGAQHCAAMHSHYGTLRLYDNGCSWKRYFVCEVP